MPYTRKGKGKRKYSAKSSYKSSKRAKYVRAPVAKTRVGNPTLAASIAGTPYGSEGRIRVKKRQYIDDIPGSTNFVARPYNINPGLKKVFPWLAGIATAYQKYVIVGLRFVYEPQAPTSTTGAVMMCTDYEPEDDAPESKLSMMSKAGSVRCAPWTSRTYSCNARMLMNNASKFIRTDDSLLSGRDVNDYDGGNFYIATEGQADNAAIGELYVEYVVDLIDPHYADQVHDGVAQHPVGVSLDGADLSLVDICANAAYPTNIVGAGSLVTGNTDATWYIKNGAIQKGEDWADSWLKISSAGSRNIAKDVATFGAMTTTYTGTTQTFLCVRLRNPGYTRVTIECERAATGWSNMATFIGTETGIASSAAGVTGVWAAGVDNDVTPMNIGNTIGATFKVRFDLIVHAPNDFAGLMLNVTEFGIGRLDNINFEANPWVFGDDTDLNDMLSIWGFTHRFL